MLKPAMEYSSKIEQLFLSYEEKDKRRVITFTFQVTDDCCLRCTYCYELNKQHNYMTKEKGEEIIDFILSEAKKEESILSYEKNIGIIIDFIGGEPFMNIDLVSHVIEYFEKRLIEENSPWLFFHRYNFSSNGVLYWDDKVQKLIRDYGDLMSVGITVDGYKELHDECRVFPDGKGSYDLAISAALDQLNNYNNGSTKITLCPENIDKTFIAIVNMLNLGFKRIQGNCVFEEGWTEKEAKILYEQMKKISDYLLQNDLEDKCYISLFSETDFIPLEDSDNENWCGGTGKMISVDHNGVFYPCIRYMPLSLPKNVPAFSVGNLEKGLYETKEDKDKYNFLTSITRKSQSTEECITCPIAKGCAWCSGYNYSKFGTPNKRATYICVMHKARALGNYYFWKNEAIKKHKENKVKLNLQKEEAIKIIGEEEYNKLVG